MFIDEITLRLKSGRGGNGISAWRHEKGIDHAGPGGGDGGSGGDVFVRGVRDVAKLAIYRFEKVFAAENGVNGKNKGMKGANGSDLIFDVPIGSIVTNTYSEEKFEIMSEEPVLVLKGGRGGFGNEHFKSSRNVAPEEFTRGTDGEEADFHIELRLVADLGLVGFPNAGKSSLLNALTNAKAKIGNYQFTTLTPNLGDFYGFVIADIPGLIEGAADGKGLGMAFLRHVTRTKSIIHCIAADTEDILAAYTTIRKELKEYSVELYEKPEFILLTKTDLVSEEEVQAKKKIVQAILKKSKNAAQEEPLSVSVIDDISLKTLADFLIQTLRSVSRIAA